MNSAAQERPAVGRADAVCASAEALRWYSIKAICRREASSAATASFACRPSARLPRQQRPIHTVSASEFSPSGGTPAASAVRCRAGAPRGRRRGPPFRVLEQPVDVVGVDPPRFAEPPHEAVREDRRRGRGARAGGPAAPRAGALTAPHPSPRARYVADHRALSSAGPSERYGNPPVVNCHRESSDGQPFTGDRPSAEVHRESIALTGNRR